MKYQDLSSGGRSSYSGSLATRYLCFHSSLGIHKRLLSDTDHCFDLGWLLLCSWLPVFTHLHEHMYTD